LIVIIHFGVESFNQCFSLANVGKNTHRIAAASAAAVVVILQQSVDGE
jgi:hypothetical protein